MSKLKTVELDYLPTRDGGPDQLHNHSSYRPTETERENCGGCSQLANDFLWLRFHEVLARADEFGTVEEAMVYAVANIEARVDPRTERRHREVAVA